ncbi:MAG: hypothetical protein K1000chlam2_00458 [Chlamydiae bacterium]|nr:hypothetical protein [Chlamydiota bacterium]
MKYSDYVVYVDESGDHGLISIDNQYPIFVLSFCIFNKKIYSEKIVPELMNLKFKTFGHDMVILHEHDIRKKKGHFNALNNESRKRFLEKLTHVISTADFTLVAVVIDKIKLQEQYDSPSHPYHLAMELGLERLYYLLKQQNQDNFLTHIIFEARGAAEDRELQEEFIRVRSGDNTLKKNLPFEIIIVDKKINSEGLQFADMPARPIGLSQLRPDQPNRAFEVLKNKFYKGPSGSIIGYGLKNFPQKAKNPKVSFEA